MVVMEVVPCWVILPSSAMEDKAEVVSMVVVLGIVANQDFSMER